MTGLFQFVPGLICSKARIGSITKISRNPTQASRRDCKFQKPDQILLGPMGSKSEMAKPEPDLSPKA